MRRAALALALLVSAGALSAQAPQDTLARRVTLNVRDISLRDALDRIAALSGMRISYSGDNLPLERRVAVQSSALLVLDVLRELLRAFAVDATAIAPDHIVLTPRTAIAVDPPAEGVAVLDRVVVTGNVLGAPERPLPIALDVVAGRDIERRDQRAISHVFGGSVPGIWVWEQAPTSMTARYGSIRGASSFGVSFPKVYLDGIEVANPLLFTQVSPELIERVEVIRGPQGAALYGSDAISGVVNIVSRHEGGGADGLDLRLRSQAGYAGSYGAGAVPVQEHAVSIRGGTNLKNAGLTLGASTSGDYIPDAYSRQLRAIADGRLILSRTTMTGNVRFFDKSAGVPASPLLPANKAQRFGADSQPQTLRMYTIGGAISHLASETWTVAANVGVDGYQLSNLSSEGSPIPFFVDSALRAASGSVARGTLRGSAVANFGAAKGSATTLTFAAEQSILRERSLEELPPVSGSGNGGPPNYVLDWTTNTGFTSQANIAIRDALFLTGGVRFEHIGVTFGESQLATLPMLGAAVVRDGGLLTTKLRVAYGRGIRAARSSPRAGMADLKHRLFNPTLKPEEQSGVEAGVDFWVAHRISVHVTRFDQRARGLVQLVSLADTARNGAVYYLQQLQNVGEITNAGWEAQTDLSLGALTLGGAASFVDSRVRRIATGYTGDMRVGDRMLGVPARTLSATATLAQRRYQLSTTLSRASDWINYDRLGIANCVLALQCTGDKELAGAALRRWWLNYPGSTRLRGSFSVDLPRGLALTATGDNLLDRQRGEPDSITIVPGRTITLGMKVRF